MMGLPRPISERGFTLLEVMVALAVLAIAMAGLIKAAGGGASNLAYLENKTIAHWVAMNQISAQRAAKDKPGLGSLQGEETMAGREWAWSVDVSETPDLDVLRLDVEVRRADEDSETVYAGLVGYVAR
jgi:general secretion pathway protein I